MNGLNRIKDSLSTIFADTDAPSEPSTTTSPAMGKTRNAAVGTAPPAAAYAPGRAQAHRRRRRRRRASTGSAPAPPVTLERATPARTTSTAPQRSATQIRALKRANPATPTRTALPTTASLPTAASASPAPPPRPAYAPRPSSVRPLSAPSPKRPRPTGPDSSGRAIRSSTTRMGTASSSRRA